MLSPEGPLGRVGKELAAQARLTSVTLGPSGVALPFSAKSDCPGEVLTRISRRGAWEARWVREERGGGSACVPDANTRPLLRQTAPRRPSPLPVRPPSSRSVPSTNPLQAHSQPAGLDAGHGGYRAHTPRPWGPLTLGRGYGEGLDPVLRCLSRPPAARRSGSRRRSVRPGLRAWGQPLPILVLRAVPGTSWTSRDTRPRAPVPRDRGLRPPSCASVRASERARDAGAGAFPRPAPGCGPGCRL